MKYSVTIALLLLAAMVCSCEDALDKFPKSKLSPETFFSNEEELEIFSNGFYTIFPSTGLYNEHWDNVLHNTLPEEMRNGRLVPGSGSGWSFTDLRKFNTLLAYSSNCPDTDAREKYDAIARFFRAYFYFEKVKRFGDVPYYDRPLDSDDPELYKPRDSREYIMGKILEDLDYAIAVLPTAKDVYRITRWSAMALKSRVCLFEGTFRKYHGIQLEGNDWQYYLTLCADVSEELMTTGGYTLFTIGDVRTVYRDLFAVLQPRADEVILARNYNYSLAVTHNANFYTLGLSLGRPGFTRKMVDYYLMADGSRYTDIPGHETMEFADQCTGRDPRLSQTIRTPGYTRIGAATQLAPDLSSSITGYQPVKFVMGTGYDSFDRSENDLAIFRIAEIYLNLAEARAELGTLTQSDLDNTVNKLRSRVGMPSLVLTDANASPDPYLMSAATGYKNVSGDNSGVILEIRRERGVELAMEGFRYYDLMRWREGNALTQDLHGIYIPGPGAYDLDGNGTIDVEFYLTSPTSAASLQLKIDEDVYLSNGTSGYLSPHKTNPTSWNEDRDYLYPIPTDDRLLTDGALTQNPGWNDGLTF